MKQIVLFLLMASYAFAVSPVARWPLDDQTGTTVIRDVIGTNDGTWVGTELVTDGAFSVPGGGGTAIFDNWTNTAAVVADGTNGTEVQDVGKLEGHGGGGSGACNLWSESGATVTVYQASILEIGTTYILSFDIWDDIGSIEFHGWDGSIGDLYGNIDITGTGKTIEFTATSTGISFTRTGTGDATLNNISVREVVVSLSTGTGIEFDGVGDYVDIGDISSNANTISLWFKPAASIDKDTTTETVIHIGSGATDMIAFGASTLNLTDEIITVFNAGGGRSGYTSATDSISAAWHHLVCVWDGSKYLIYLDGVQKQNAIHTVPALLSADGMEIGRKNDDSAYFTGRISDVRIYNVALTADQVKGLFKGEGRRQRARYNNKEYEPSLRSRYN